MKKGFSIIIKSTNCQNSHFHKNEKLYLQKRDYQKPLTESHRMSIKPSGHFTSLPNYRG